MHQTNVLVGASSFRCVSSVAQSDCVRHPIRLRPPPNRIAFVALMFKHEKKVCQNSSIGALTHPLLFCDQWSCRYYPQKNSTTSCAVKIRRNILNG